jgi:hypothetical protein
MVILSQWARLRTTGAALAFRGSNRHFTATRPRSRIACNLEHELLAVKSLHAGGGYGQDHAVRTAPVFTREVLDVVYKDNIFPQRSLYGTVLASKDTNDRAETSLYINTNHPFSGVVCGVQVRILGI